MQSTHVHIERSCATNKATGFFPQNAFQCAHIYASTYSLEWQEERPTANWPNASTLIKHLGCRTGSSSWKQHASACSAFYWNSTLYLLWSSFWRRIYCKRVKKNEPNWLEMMKIIDFIKQTKYWIFLLIIIIITIIIIMTTTMTDLSGSGSR